MRRFSLLLLASVWMGCIDFSAIHGFECDDAGRCTSDGGGATGGGEGATGGGGPNGGGADAGTPDAGSVCGPETCTGCCAASQCLTGTTSDACGQSGGLCAPCDASERCQASRCQPLVPNGSTCTISEECSSRACVDGVCCSTACTSPCSTCAANGNEGHCRPLPEGTTPAACGALACDGVSGDCPTTCTSSRQCAPGYFCAAGGICTSIRDAGASCVSNSECASRYCSDGVCCDQPCSGSCDRCDLSGAVGKCQPVAQGDQGSPFCGGGAVCDGKLVDCPIPCNTGCPPSTYCSGTYCSAQKANGTVCSAALECASGVCADGVCCNASCGGVCNACSAAHGATSDGTCTVLGASRLCRPSASVCDVEDRCDGVSANCPANVFVDAGTDCNVASYSPWSECDGGAVCAQSGTQSRVRTDHRCTGGGLCGAVQSAETRACARTTNGLSCGASTFGDWSNCAYASTCVESGNRTRTRADPVCQAAACGNSSSTETDTAGCSRSTTGVTCASPSQGAWSACSYSATCSTTGTRARSVTASTCGGGACNTSSSTETDGAGCNRSTTGVACGATETGAWSGCSYANACATGGSRTRTITTHACNGSGACASNTSTEIDTAGCSRSTTGVTCATPSQGAWGACSYSATCSTTGTRTRSVTASTCGGGACNTSSSTETDGAGCNRSTTGVACGTTEMGAWSACSYANTCATGGSRTRTITTHACNGSGACASNTSTETDTAGCARVTQGTMCATTQVTYSACVYSTTCANGGSRTQTTSTFACNAGGMCVGTPVAVTDTAGCARNTNNNSCGTTTCGACRPCNVDCEMIKLCTENVCSAGACTTRTNTESCGFCTDCTPR